MSDSSNAKHYLALSGGVGGAKLALGLAKTLAPEQLTIVANTADDFVHLGLPISPDLDTVMYTLAGISNREQGWGLEGESWNTMDALQDLEGESWFRLGDRDIATHLRRGELLREGRSLTEVTATLSRALGVAQTILPMSDDSVATQIETESGELPFQHYFVREQCQPKVKGFRFAGIEQATPQPDWLETLQSDTLRAVIICPSNPFVSVAPMLELRGVRDALAKTNAPVIAVSPIVAGGAIKGPAAKMMAELAMPVTAHSVAEYYGDLLDGYVIDESDAALVDAIGGITRVISAPTVMKSLQDRVRLAETVIQFAEELRQQ